MPQPTLSVPQGVMPKKILNFRRSSPPADKGSARQGSRDGGGPHHHQNRFQAMDIFHLNQDRRRQSGSIASRASADATATPTTGLSPAVGPAKPAALTISIESPPLVAYGPAQSSSGALLSGQLSVTVTDPEVQLESLQMRLLARVRYRKPVAKDCAECAVQTTELKTWTFLSERAPFRKGSHSCPFSYLLPGHLPATTHSTLGALDYVLTATAATPLEPLTPITHVLALRRSLPPAPQDRASVRVFPPTALRAEVAHPPVAHPIGAFPVHLRLAGLRAPPADPQDPLQRRWRLRKCNWRLEESAELISPACARHAPRLGGAGKGLLHADARALGAAELKDGWKTDFDADAPDCDGGARGVSELDFACSANARHLSPGAVCDADDPSGLKVAHRLVVELVVAEEVAAARARSAPWNPSGTARVLRMTFAVQLTERAGLGISWDEEMPPMYDDVPASPPGYARLDDYVGEMLPLNDLDLRR